MSKNRNLYFEDELSEQKFNGFMLRRLISYAGAYKAEYIRVIILLVGTSFLSLIPAAINMYIIDKILPKNGVVPGNVQVKSVIMLTLWISLSLGAVISDFITTKMSTKLGNSIICNLRKDLFDKLMELSFNYYDNRPTGKILVRITNYTDEIASFFIQDMTRVVSNIFIIIITFVCMAVIEIRIAFVTLAASIPLGILMWVIAKGLHKRVRNDRNKQSNRTAFVAEDINGLEVIKSFNREKLNDEIFIELSEKYLRAYARSTRFRELFYPLSHGIMRITCNIVIYLATLFIISKNIGGGISIGALVTVTAYMQRFSNAVFVVCRRLQSITNVTANMERIFEVIDTPAEICDSDNATELGDIKGAVDFNDVTFSYIKDIPVLENVNLSVKPGEMIALVGPTGAGKTTIVSLISRFYDIDGGSITIDGKDVRDVTIASLRKNVGVMMQDTFLFNGSIMDNIRFGRPEASDDECVEAAKKVFAHDFIMAKPDGYNTVISGQGSGLSGGERQLLSFARLILADPKIIILDEATSNIDTETEKLIQQMFRTVLKGRTSFIIAHRLSTIRNADRILYIDNKGILEDGSHNELVAKKGYYYRMVAR